MARIIRETITWLILGCAALMAWPGLGRAAGAGLQALPPDLIERIEAGAPGLLDEAGSLILAYGQGGSIDGAGIETAIAHHRARRRAAELGRLLAADLDGDGTVTTDELAVHQRAGAPRAAARAKLAQDRADANGDGAVTLAEAQASASRQAERGFSAERAEKLRAILRMDMDGNGRVGLDEVAAVIARQLEAATASAPAPGRPGAERAL